MLESKSAEVGTDTLVLRSRQWAKLIGKLRWAGMEDEAFRLETIVASLPTRKRPSVFAEPFETD
ncbi:MAG TPA: hypothetical protein VNS34_03410 [Rhizobiaceae bacterium]|nr:hypothetical protein [Rhizobiaceae bacterium]